MYIQKAKKLEALKPTNEDDVPFDVREIVGSLFVYGLADVNNGKQDIKYISLLYV